MRKYRLFSEWRGIGLWGKDLGDALRREGSVQETDQYAAGIKEADGERHEIVRVIHCCGVAERTRGGKSYDRALVEVDGGRIIEVDGVLVEEV